MYPACISISVPYEKHTFSCTLPFLCPRVHCAMQLLYITFLAEFFSDDEGLDMDMMYYSEMKDAGYFEDSYEQF